MFEAQVESWQNAEVTPTRSEVERRLAPMDLDPPLRVVRASQAQAEYSAHPFRPKEAQGVSRLLEAMVYPLGVLGLGTISGRRCVGVMSGHPFDFCAQLGSQSPALRCGQNPFAARS